MIYIEINKKNYSNNLKYIHIDESLNYPFKIKVSIIPGLDELLKEPFIHKQVLIKFDENCQEKDSFTWCMPVDKKTYFGYVFKEKRLFTSDNDFNELLLTVYHPLFLLVSARRFQIFYEKSLFDIFYVMLKSYQEVFSKYNIDKPQISETLKSIILPYCTQYLEDDLSFISRLCETYGARIILHNKKILIQGLDTPFKLSYLNICKIPSEARIKKTEELYSISRHLFHRNILCTEKTEDLTTTEEKTSPPKEALEPQPYWMELDVNDPEIAKKQLHVHKLSIEHQQSSITIYNSPSFNNKPLVGLRCGDIITLPNETIQYYIHKIECHCDEDIVIKALKHNFDYEIIIHATKTNLPYVMPPIHKKPRVHSLIRALVVEPLMSVDGDPDKLGRIKVRFLWDESENTTCWVRLMMPYAGKQHGIYVMPELNDEVLIGFEGGDIDRPYCLGSIYNMDNTTLQQMTSAEQMETIMIRTPQNMYLKFHETNKGKQEYKINIQDNIIVNAIKDKKELNYKIKCLGDANSAIQLDGKGNISVESDKKIVISSKQITVNGSDLLILQGGEIQIKSPGEIIVNGQVIRLN